MRAWKGLYPTGYDFRRVCVQHLSINLSDLNEISASAYSMFRYVALGGGMPRNYLPDSDRTARASSRNLPLEAYRSLVVVRILGV